MTTQTTRASSQQSEQTLEGQLRTIEADYQRLFEQKGDALINLLFAKLHRLLIEEAGPQEEQFAARVVFETERYDTGVEFNASAACYHRDGDEVDWLDEALREEDYGEVERLIGELNLLYSPFSGGESLELRLILGSYVLTR
jgi:hypothetical protein